MKNFLRQQFFFQQRTQWRHPYPILYPHTVSTEMEDNRVPALQIPQAVVKHLPDVRPCGHKLWVGSRPVDELANAIPLEPEPRNQLLPHSVYIVPAAVQVVLIGGEIWVIAPHQQGPLLHCHSAASPQVRHVSTRHASAFTQSGFVLSEKPLIDSKVCECYSVTFRWSDTYVRLVHGLGENQRANTIKTRHV